MRARLHEIRQKRPAILATHLMRFRKHRRAFLRWLASSFPAWGPLRGHADVRPQLLPDVRNLAEYVTAGVPAGTLRDDNDVDSSLMYCLRHRLHYDEQSPRHEQNLFSDKMLKAWQGEVAKNFPDVSACQKDWLPPEDVGPLFCDDFASARLGHLLAAKRLLLWLSAKRLGSLAVMTAASRGSALVGLQLERAGATSGLNSWPAGNLHLCHITTVPG